MNNRPDWEAIREEYESSNTSFRELAEKRGVDHTTLYRRSKKWNATQRNAQENATRCNEVAPLRIVRTELPSIPSAVDGANLGIQALVGYLRENAKTMGLLEHVKAATALYQYNRIIVNAAPEEEEDKLDLVTIDTRDLSPDELAKMKAFALEMKEQQQVG